MMDEYLTTFKRDLIGRTRNKATMNNLIREVFGENTGDAAARELAGAWGGHLSIFASGLTPPAARSPSAWIGACHKRTAQSGCAL
jgi:hypothetical protein